MNRRVRAAVATAVLVLAATGCAGKATEPYEDADRGKQNAEPADTITFPDGFSNVATKCDHGNRVYVIFKADQTYGSIDVVPNAKGC